MNSADSQEKSAKLVVEGGIQILYKGIRVTEIPFDNDEITVGVMDPENDIYPDVNLRQYRLDGGDPYISRNHAKFTKEEGKYFVEDICGNNSTSIGTKTNVLNKAKEELNEGDRVFVSESIALRFEFGTATTPTEEASPEESSEDSPENPQGLVLEMEQASPLFFKPKSVFTHIFELNSSDWDTDEADGNKALHIGRRSTEDDIYPDIDLWKFYFNNGDEYIARRHARIFEKEDKLYFQDVSGKGSTWINEKDDDNRLLRSEENDASREIKEGDKFIISDSVTFIVRQS